MGRFFVQNQVPEYVGAAQKRFAWALGLLLALPMFYLLVIHFQPNPIKVLICIICLLLLIAESAFSICLGCKIYNFIKKEKATNCPGGVCEIREKEAVQKFNLAQKIITILVFVFTVGSLYLYTTKLENRTFLMKKVTQMMMSDEERKAIEDAEYERDLEAFFEDDDE